MVLVDCPPGSPWLQQGHAQLAAHLVTGKPGGTMHHPKVRVATGVGLDAAAQVCHDVDQVFGPPGTGERRGWAERGRVGG
jgi:hypothetical protein